MRILADENCDRLIVTALREAGHDVAFIVEGVRGIDDPSVIARAQREMRVILTDDLDFGRLAELERDRSPAIFLMRLGMLPRQARVKRVVDVVASYEGSVVGQLVVIEPGQLRLRPHGKVG